MSQKKYAVVGTGGRCRMYLDAIVGDYKDVAKLVGFCDTSQTRMDWHNKRLVEECGIDPVPTYSAGDFDKMVAEQKPDVVIVTSMDATHHTYIIRAMELGCDAITEKPMTTDAQKANAIFDAIEKTGKNLRVTFNYRYPPHVTKVKELLQKGTIGKPLAVDLSWTLNTSHGADYFRRWHSDKKSSGGLLIHKSTHHFDMVNWWLRARPKRVFAMGDLKFYGQKAAESRGEHYSYDRYHGHPESKEDPFALDMDSDENMKGLYLDAEKDSGYVRDKNVFRQGIDIEDTMAVMVHYDTNVIFNYSLIAYCPWEGYRVSVTGTKGRIELYDRHGSHIIAGQSDKEIAEAQARDHQQKLTVFPMFGSEYDVEITKAQGGHGGGDPILLEQIFSPNPPADPYERAASQLDGASSILIGISANESMRTGQPVDCDSLVKLPPYEALVPA